MKWPLFILIFILVSCAQIVARNPSAKSEERHVVFDIDWTIVSEIKNPTKSILASNRVVEVSGVHYYINDGVEELVAAIRSHSDVRISFYSGGKQSRNVELLSKIKLKDGTSLKDLAYKILSNEDLAIVENAPPGARFAEKFKKDLTKISKNLDQLIMFDDTANFVLDGTENQSEHVFFLGKAFEYFEKYSDAEGKTGEYVPMSYDQWFLSRKKLNVINTAFNEAYAESEATGISFSEAMKKREELLNLKDHEWNNFSRAGYQKFLGVVKPEVKVKDLDCHQLTKALIFQRAAP